MGKYYHPADILSNVFESYDTALKHYENVKPIRGSNPEVRPIGRNRRYKNCEIRKGTDCIEAVLYGTPIIRIYKDNRVQLMTSSWISPTTVKFMDAVLPSKFGLVYIDRKRVILSQRDFVNEDWRRYEIPQTEEGLILQTDKDWLTATPANAPIQFQYVANRKVLNKIRSNFKAFLDYLKVTTSMSSVFSSDEFIELFPEVGKKFLEDRNERLRLAYPYHASTGWHLRHAIYSAIPRILPHNNEPRTAEQVNMALAMAASNDPIEWRKLTLLLVLRPSYISCRDDATAVSIHDLIPAGQNWVPTPVVTWLDFKDGLLEAFSDLIKIAYADVCFVHKEVKQGVIPVKTNKFYVDTHAKLKDNLTVSQYVRI